MRCEGTYTRLDAGDISSEIAYVLGLDVWNGHINLEWRLGGSLTS